MTDPFAPGASYTREEVLAAAARLPRRVVLGSSSEQINAAIALCQEASSACTVGIYADEIQRTVVLKPFRIDPTAVTVGAFREFVASTGYRTQAERSGGAYVFSKGQLHLKAGSDWRDAAGTGKPSEQSAVVGVSFADAEAYCAWRKARLPTEDEWEYAARGPEASIFPWGNDPAPARARVSQRPDAADGSREGPGGSLRGMSGNVWEWVDTQGAQGPGQKVLKGGSWLEDSAANKRGAVRRSELATMADSDSGFRCARSEGEWPDAAFWVGRLR
jgi:formylglycine-generating enzyme required for sulfatase activity